MRSTSMSWRACSSEGRRCSSKATTPAIERIIHTAQGDARRCLNLLEWSHHLVPQGPLTEEAVSVAAVASRFSAIAKAITTTTPSLR